MRILTTLLGATFVVAANAQSPLIMQPTGSTYGWTVPPASGQTFFNLTVNSQLTLQALTAPVFTAAGTIGQLEVYITNTATTYVGNETNAAAWTKVASGFLTAKGTVGSLANLSAVSCQVAIAGGGLVLQPGTHGVAIRYINLAPVLQAVAAPQTFSTTEMTTSGGAVQYTAFASTPTAPPSGFTGWSWWGSIDYANGAVPHACAEISPYGAGCYTKVGSFYQEFTSAAAASTGLTGRSITMVPTGSGYSVLPGQNVTFLAPSATATALPATDDGEAQITLTAPFFYPGGLATDLFVHSNGYVSVATNNTLTGPNWVPEIPVFLTAPASAWWSWHDYNPTEAGSGLIYWEEVGPIVYITWNGVESYPTTAANPSTFQFQFDTSTGFVNYIWQTVDAVGGSGVLQGDDTLVGYSPGGISPDGGPTTIATLTGITLNEPEVFALHLEASAKPLLGTTIDLVTSNETTLNGIGLNFVSVFQFAAPGIDLGIIGAPGCVGLIDIGQGVGNIISNIGGPGLQMTIPFPLPNNQALAGFHVYSQSIWLDPAANAFGVLTSNGVGLTLGNF